MGLFEQFPWTNYDRLNLDMIIRQINALKARIEEVAKYEGIKYADPLQWSIASQYEANTVVVASDGTAYLSTQPVPAGITITDTDYWTPIANFSDLWGDLKNSIAAIDIGTSPTATATITVGSLFWQNNILKIALENITQGSMITASNAADITIEEYVESMRGTAELFLSVAAFGAVGDGVTDDTDAIKAAVNTANGSGQTLIFESGKTYKMRAESIPVRCSIDFNNATIISDTETNDTIFAIEPENTTGGEYSSAVFTNNATTESTLFGKAFTIISPLSLGIRQGFGTEIYYRQHMITDKLGNYINEPYYPQVISGSYEVVNVHEIGEEICLSNLNINYSGHTAGYPVAIKCRRSNVKIENVQISGSTASSSYVGAVLEISNCSYITLRDIHAEALATLNGSGYILLLDCTSDVLIDGCDFHNNTYQGWGTIGSSWISRTTIDRSTLTRADWHYMSVGFLNIRNSTIYEMTIGGGYGDVVVENSILYNQENKTSFIGSRTDLVLQFFGNIVYKDCRFRRNGGNLYIRIQGANANDQYLNGCDTNLVFIRPIFLDNVNAFFRLSNGSGNTHDLNLTIEGIQNRDTDTAGYIVSNAAGAVQLGHLVIRDCDLSVTGSPLSTGSSTDLVAFKNIDYINTDFGNAILGFRTTSSPSRISVINSEFGGFTYSLAVEMLRAIGCVIRGSRTFTANSPRVGVANICVDDQTYESAWNVGVAH